MLFLLVPFPLEALDIHELWVGVVRCPPLEFGKVSCLRNRGEKENFYVVGAAKINLAQIFLQPSSPKNSFWYSQIENVTIICQATIPFARDPMA